MSQTIDSVYLGTIANVKLSAQAAPLDLDLRLLVGHSNLLNLLMPELVDNYAWSNKTQSRSRQQDQRGNQGKSNLVKHFGEYLPDEHPDHYDECLPDEDPDFESTSDSDDYSDSQSDLCDNSEDNGNDHDNRTPGIASQSTTQGTKSNKTTDLNLLENQLAYLEILESQANLPHLVARTGTACTGPQR